MSLLFDAPPLWQWLAEQHNNTDPVRAAAARELAERWQLGTHYNHRRALATLQAEESEHLHGAQLLTEDFVELFNVSPEDQLGEHRVGQLAPLVPISREQCGHTYKSGKVCTRDSVPGAGMCGKHGGSWMNESERAEMVNRISEKLVDLGDRAVATMAYLMDNAKSEKVRGDMAMGLLDRIGVGPISKVELEITSGAEHAADRVQGRILELAARNGEVVQGTVLSYTDELQGVIPGLEDDDDGPDAGVVDAS